MQHRKAYISKYMIIYMARKIELKKGELNIKDKISLVFEKTITKFGTGAKIDAPKEFLGKKVYVMIRED